MNKTELKEDLKKIEKQNLQMLRLQVAAQVMSGIIVGDGDYFYYFSPGSKYYMPNSISRKCPGEVARVAFIFADALIA